MEIKNPGSGIIDERWILLQQLSMEQLMEWPTMVANELKSHGSGISINKFKRTHGMNKILLSIVSLVLAAVVVAKAQVYEKTELGIKSSINSIEVEIQFYNPSTVRVLKSPEGRSFTKKSLSVIETPKKSAINLKQIGDVLSVKSTSIQVDLNLKSGKISFSTLTGEPLLSEREKSVAFTDFNDAGVRTYSVYQ